MLFLQIMNKAFFLIPRRRVRLKQAEYLAHKEAARTLVHARLMHFNQFYKFSYNRVSIKNIRSRWGSCSSLGNLNFSYRIVFLSPEAQDYIIVHELCHLGEFNHSSRFWQLVEKQIPNYQNLHQKLKRGIML